MIWLYTIYEWEIEPLTQKIILHINYVPGSVKLDEDTKVKLDDLALRLKVYKDIHIQVNGYTDRKGSAGANKRISLLRAREIKRYLISKGIDEGRIIARGLGATNFIATNDTPEGRQKNRRIENLYLFEY